MDTVLPDAFGPAQTSSSAEQNTTAPNDAATTHDGTPRLKVEGTLVPEVAPWEYKPRRAELQPCPRRVH